jgi:hypothetical protein
VAQSKAYHNLRFLGSIDARPLRILAEYLEPLSRFQRQHVQDTIVFMGSARLKSREAASAAVAEAETTASCQPASCVSGYDDRQWERVGWLRATPDAWRLGVLGSR